MFFHGTHRALCVALAAGLIASVVGRTAQATVIFKDDFTTRTFGTDVFNTQPNLVDVPGAVYHRNLSGNFSSSIGSTPGSTSKSLNLLITQGVDTQMLYLPYNMN